MDKLKTLFFSGLSGLIAFIMALPAMADSWPSDNYMKEGKTYTGAATSANLGVTSNTASTPVVANPCFTLSPGYYLGANQLAASACDAGYYCPGGSFCASNVVQGKTQCTGNNYSAASASACTPCNTGYTISGSAASSHTAASYCKGTITLNKNGGTGKLMLNGSEYTSSTVTCSQGVECTLPHPDLLVNATEKKEYSTGWGTSSSCTSGTLTLTNPTAGTTYYACKSTPVITLEFKTGTNTQNFYYRCGGSHVYTTKALARAAGSEGIVGTTASPIVITGGVYAAYVPGYTWDWDASGGYFFTNIATDGSIKLTVNESVLHYLCEKFTTGSYPKQGFTAELKMYGEYVLVPNASYTGSNGQSYSVEVQNNDYTHVIYTYNGKAYTDRTLTTEFANNKIVKPTPKESYYYFGGYKYNTTYIVGSGGIINSTWLANAATGGALNAVGIWEGDIPCSPGEYLDQETHMKMSCPAGYYCPGGTFDFTTSFSDMAHVCPKDSYSTGGAASSTCTPCSSLGTGYFTPEWGILRAEDHDSASDCRITITNLNKNGGTGNLSSSSVTCNYGVECTFPTTSGLTLAGYTFNDKWATDAACTGGGSKTITSPSASATYYACKGGKPIYIQWLGVQTGGTGFTAVSGESNAYTSTVPYGGDIKTPQAGVSATGQSFLGWRFKKSN